MTLQAVPLEWEDKRARIEQTALALFLQNGIENTSVNQITKQAQIAKGTFYLYFKDKDELVRNSLVHQNLKALDESLKESQLKSNQTIQSWTSNFVTTLMDFYEQNPKILCFIQKNRDLCALSSYLESDTVLNETPYIKAFLSNLTAPGESETLSHVRFIIIMDILTSVSYLLYSGRNPGDRKNLRAMVLKTALQLCDHTFPVSIEEELK